MDQKDEVVDPIEFIYRIQKHIPDKGEVMIRYYGFYSNAGRGKRNRHTGECSHNKKVPVPLGEDFPARKELRKRWAALIQKVYEVDPLCCPRCGSTMRIIAYSDQWEVILRILKHLNLWPPPKREPAQQRAPPDSMPHISDVSYTYEFDFDPFT